jgi:hypothetical protein
MAHGAATIGDVASYVRCCWRFNREAHVGGVHPSSRPGRGLANLQITG